MAEEKKENTARIDQEKQAKLKAKTEADEIKNMSSAELRTKLSNKNSDYVFRLQKELEKQGNMNADDAAARVDQLLPEIIIAQRRGQPANDLYMASPSIKAEQILHPEKKPKTLMDIPFWQRATDSTLLWLGTFTAFYGLMGIFNTKIQSTQNGVLTILVFCILLGVFWAKYNEWTMPKSKDNRRPKMSWPKLLGISALFVVGLFVLMGIFMLPIFKVINPVLPGIAYLIIAVIAFAGRCYFRKYYHITGSVFMPNPQSGKSK
ncbi:DUF1129 family protein [Lactobacillus amylolyticus]|uniref:DUF1129 family protein n=1 Tax=Lactobacillus amylolyticus TaxID=83683 RepID=UPI000FCA183E|nr:DUF1129 family protein [Lactobacillus amylolyticus]